MDYGAHLPLIAFNGKPASLNLLVEYTEAAERLGFVALAANDHLLFSRPWLDGPTALAAVLTSTRHMTLGTTVALPVVRGPVPLTKTLAALDHLSQGRLFVGVGPGSSPRDYEAVGVPFEERWKRLEEGVKALRSLWRREEGKAFVGEFYSTEAIRLEPYPHQQPGPPIWLGSWGSDAGLRRTARLGDGWLASAYNTTPEAFALAWSKLREHLIRSGRNLEGFPNAIATMLLYVTEDRGKAERMVREVVSPAFNRPENELMPRLLIGPALECAEKLAAYQRAGAQRIFVWPVADEVRQLSVFQDQVVDKLPG